MLQPVQRLVRKYLARRRDVPEIASALQLLKQKGFSPRSIFDVGAYRGDFAVLCFRLWPQTRITCFEVLPNPAKRILAMAEKQRNLQLVSCLLGAEDRELVQFHLAETASSVLSERAHPQTVTASFPMRTVDHVVEEDCGGEAPEFLKLDVQGYELEVLKGAVGSLSSIQVILAEVNFLEIYEQVPLFGDFVSWLSERGWVAYDICSLIRRPLDRALWQADMLFVPLDSPLRQDKRYA